MFNKFTDSTLSSNQSNSKVLSSRGTDIGSEDLLKKQRALDNCSSSISIEDTLQYSRQKQLFAQLLFCKGSNKERTVFQQMQNHYLSLQCELKLIDFTKLSTNTSDLKDQIYDHFINAWLQHMGYGSSKNKKMFLSRIKSLLGPSALYKYSKVYHNFDELMLTRQEKLDLLMQTCRKGWEYFIGQIVKREQENLHNQGNTINSMEENGRHFFPIKSCRVSETAVFSK